jgi:hypothetical protein
MIMGVAGTDGGLGNSGSPHLSRSFFKNTLLLSISRNHNYQEGNKCYDVNEKYGFR